MRLASVDPVSEHGSFYVPLNDGYFLAASAFACSTAMTPDDDLVERDITTGTAQVKAILESVRLAE